MQLQSMPDVIVIVPGILGSVLVKDGLEVWGGSGASVIRNLATFGRALNDLKLEPGIGHDDPDDGVIAPFVLPRLHMIPTFWKADGYGRLLAHLSARFTLTPAADDRPGNLVEFPYDWRLSNQLNAQRLAGAVVPHLERWRRDTHNPDAKLIFVCHSMGGLIARWFLEVLGGHELTRTLITIGTPYQGAVNALTSLANRTFLGVGPFGTAIDELVRSFPSAYQLLPTYPCLDLGDGQLQGLAGIELPNICAGNVKEALEFHDRLNGAVAKSPRYQIFAVKGVDQPTAQSALVRNGMIVPLRSHKGTDYGGDGTVPRPSSHPPEWGNDTAAVFMPQKHAMLQSTDALLTQVFGILTDQLGNFMGGARIGADFPDVVQPGAGVTIDATSLDGDPTLPLHVICEGEDGHAVGSPMLMDAMGDGRYRATISDLPEGAWRITVCSPTPVRPVDPVSDWMLVVNPETAQ
jgi:hypothetical protein